MKHTNTKRLLSLILSVCMILTMFSGLTMTASAATGTYKLYSGSTISAGKYVLVDSNTGVAMTTTVASNWVKPTTEKYTGEAIENPQDNIVWDISADGVIKTGESALYSSAAKKIALSTTQSTNWTFEVNSETKVWTIKDGTNILSLNGTSGWRPYNNGYGSNLAFKLYKLDESSTVPYTLSVTWDATGMVQDNTGATVAETQDVPAGTEVKLTAVPNEGYELDDWSVECENGTTLETKREGTTLTFTMPSTNVTIYAAFKEAAPVYSITCGEVTERTAGGESAPVSDAKITADKTSAKAGETVTLGLETTGTTRYNVLEWYVTAEDGSTVEAPDGQFVMPAANVTVTAYVEAEKPYTVNFIDRGSQVETATVYAGEPIKEPAYAPADEVYGYTFVGWSYSETVAEPYTAIDWAVYTPDEAGVINVYAVYAKITETKETKTVLQAKDGATTYYAGTFNGKFEAVSDIKAATGFTKDVNPDNVNEFNLSFVNKDEKTVYIGNNADSTTVPTSEGIPSGYNLVIDATKENAIKSANSTRYLLLHNNATFSTYAGSNIGKAGYIVAEVTDVTISDKEETGHTTNPQPEPVNHDYTMVFNYESKQTLSLAELTGRTDKVENCNFNNCPEPGFGGSFDVDSFIGGSWDNTQVSLRLIGALSKAIEIPYTVNFKDGTSVSGTITVTTGDEIYFDDSSAKVGSDKGIFTFTDGTKAWEVTGTKDEIRLDANNSHSDLEKFTSATYHAGAIHKVTVANGDAAWPTVTFDFWGTGFDLISAMDSNTGAILVTVKQYDDQNVPGDPVKTALYDLYHGATQKEDGTWEAQDKGIIYQIPTVVDLKNYGHYQAEISVRYSAVFDHLSKDGQYDFYFDGVRIHNPLNAAPHYKSITILDQLKTEAANTPVFIDGMTVAKASDIDQYGIKGEVLLEKGQSVALRVGTTAANVSIEIGAHSINGTPSHLAVYEENTTTAATYEKDIVSSTEMHYPVDNLTVTDGNTRLLIITNTGSGILALTDIRSADKNITVTFQPQDAEKAVRFVKRLTRNAEKFESLTDVVEGAWYYDHVKTIVEAGIMEGKGNGIFAPNEKLTRAEVVKVLYNLAGSPEVEATHSFTDVEAGSWYEPAVAWGAANGIVKGKSETSFDPKATVTREQMVVFLHRYVGGEKVETDEISAFVDGASVSAFAVDAMNWAVANEIVAGMGHNDLAPKGTSTRAQMAKILATCPDIIG